MIYEFKEVEMSQELFSGLYYTEDKILELINILDESYLSKLNEIKSDPSETSNILDKIGQLLGVYRIVNVNYIESGQTINEEINLNDEEYLIYIKSQIIKSNYDGTREQILEYYSNIGLDNIIFKNDNTPGNVIIYLPESSITSTNIKKLFLNGSLQVTSIGIGYSFQIKDAKILKWEGYNKNDGKIYTGNNTWDDGKWGI